MREQQGANAAGEDKLSFGDGATDDAAILRARTDSFTSTDGVLLEELRDRIVITLLFDQIITMDQVNQAWEVWRQRPEKARTDALWRAVANVPGVDRRAIYATAARQYAFKEVRRSMPQMQVFIEQVSEEFTEEQWGRMVDLRLLPVSREATPHASEVWIFATSDPIRKQVNDFLDALGLPKYEVRFLEEDIATRLIDEMTPRRNEYLERMRKQDLAYDLGAGYEQTDTLIDEEALEAQISQSALINLFEAMLIEAVREGASDIHVWPNDDKQIEIHFRRDGKLHLWVTEDRIHPEAFLAVVKDNATNIDRFDREAAQDGFMQRWIDGVLIRFRVSVLPITNATQYIRSESIVIRVLDDRKIIKDLTDLGLDDLALRRFEEAIYQPYGMVILTGPTGSGKTTTLYAALQHVATPDLNVLTVEDPVEYNLRRIRQIKLNPRLRLEHALRAILRHDPDVVMVGEMRDRATAELAIKLANTGHLTFSTLHTNDAPSAVSRLYKMGIEPFLIAYAINLVVAQRLIRVLCPDCKEEDETRDALLLETMGFSQRDVRRATFYRAGSDKTCTTCEGRGYKGRRAITETLPFSEDIRRIILVSNDMIDEAALRKQALSEGMLTLTDSARSLVLAGETSVAAMRRVASTK